MFREKQVGVEAFEPVILNRSLIATPPRRLEPFKAAGSDEYTPVSWCREVAEATESANTQPVESESPPRRE